VLLQLAEAGDLLIHGRAMIFWIKSCEI
jgi:hypothetical protein